jgi:hypothetical protein
VLHAVYQACYAGEHQSSGLVVLLSKSHAQLYAVLFPPTVLRSQHEYVV